MLRDHQTFLGSLKLLSIGLLQRQGGVYRNAVINTAKLMCETLKMRWDPLVPFYGRLGALSTPLLRGSRRPCKVILSLK
jgi:hypothetical protein